MTIRGEWGRKGRMNDDSSKSRRKGRMNDDSSKSRRIIRSLSAIGNRTYSAPEVKNKVRRIETVGEYVRRSEGNQCKVLGYRLWATMAWSPDRIQRGLHSSFFVDRNTCSLRMSTNLWPITIVCSTRQPGGLVARWQSVEMSAVSQCKSIVLSEDIPIEAVRLIKGMTQPNAKVWGWQTVRGVRLDPYVNDAVGEKTTFREEMVIYSICATELI
jgi:hypothetical protein